MTSEALERRVVIEGPDGVASGKVSEEGGEDGETAVRVARGEGNEEGGKVGETAVRVAGGKVGKEGTGKDAEGTAVGVAGGKDREAGGADAEDL
jgi:hypothetical protein